jgi:GntR family transcriptional regulator/MocR family aminotransferase
LDASSPLPLSVRVAHAIAEEVRRGRLRPGAALPGSRTLAEQLGISRNTVFAAYRELAAEGWITATRARGTVVAQGLGNLGITKRSAVRTERALEAAGFDLGPGAPHGFEERSAPAHVLKWDFGLPDVRLAPTRELARAYRRALSSQALLEYERYVSRPQERLERAVATMLTETRGLAVNPTNVLITRGSQMGLYLLARGLVRAGDVIAIEDPGYSEAWKTFHVAGARVVTVRVDGEGLDVGHLEDIAKAHSLRAVYVTPHHQLPTTVTLSAARRLALMRLAQRHRFAVIEDDWDHEFHYDGRPVLPLASADHDGLVAYVGSLSKIFAPGVRLGFLVAPSRLVEHLRRFRNLIDVQDDHVANDAIAELFEDGEMQRHVNRSRRIYRARRDFLAAALARGVGSALRFTVPPGGMALWAAVDPAIDVEAWHARALARGLFFRTGTLFYFERASGSFVRLGFARWNERELGEAVARFARAIPTRGRR